MATGALYLTIHGHFGRLVVAGVSYLTSHGNFEKLVSTSFPYLLSHEKFWKINGDWRLISPAFPAHAQHAILHILQEAHTISPLANLVCLSCPIISLEFLQSTAVSMNFMEESDSMRFECTISYHPWPLVGVRDNVSTDNCVHHANQSRQRKQQCWQSEKGNVCPDPEISSYKLSQICCKRTTWCFLVYIQFPKWFFPSWKVFFTGIPLLISLSLQISTTTVVHCAKLWNIYRCKGAKEILNLNHKGKSLAKWPLVAFRASSAEWQAARMFPL